MTKASESRKGNSSKQAVSQVRNRQANSGGNPEQPAAKASVNSQAAAFLKSHDAITLPELERAAHICSLAMEPGENNWLYEMGLEILRGQRAAPAHPGEGMRDMERKVDKAMALLQSQGEELSRCREREWTDDKRGSFACGFTDLGYDTAVELHQAFERAWDCAFKGTLGEGA